MFWTSGIRPHWLGCPGSHWDWLDLAGLGCTALGLAGLDGTGLGCYVLAGSGFIRLDRTGLGWLAVGQEWSVLLWDEIGRDELGCAALGWIQ